MPGVFGLTIELDRPIAVARGWIPRRGGRVACAHALRSSSSPQKPTANGAISSQTSAGTGLRAQDEVGERSSEFAATSKAISSATPQTIDRFSNGRKEKTERTALRHRNTFTTCTTTIADRQAVVACIYRRSFQASLLSVAPAAVDQNKKKRRHCRDRLYRTEQKIGAYARTDRFDLGSNCCSSSPDAPRPVAWYETQEQAGPSPPSGYTLCRIHWLMRHDRLAPDLRN